MANRQMGTRIFLTEPDLRRGSGRGLIETAARARGTSDGQPDEHDGPPATFIGPDTPHQRGIFAFVVQAVVDAREWDGGLVDWLDAAESEHRFMSRAGRDVRITPDCSFGLEADGVQYWVLLEYECERVDPGELRSKLEGYREYYEASEWKQQFPAEPVLLYVCASSQAEKLVFRALSGMPAGISTFVTTDERYWRNRDTSLSVLGDIWRVPRTDEFGSAFPRISV